MKYKTKNGWTKESMINHIKAEFKGKSFSGNQTTCLYRHPQGKKCAVGMFIPDEAYDNRMEGLSATNMVKEFSVGRFLPLSRMQDLQNVHDGSHPDTTLQEMLTWVKINVE